jgi:chloride channel protein, CIC family
VSVKTNGVGQVATEAPPRSLEALADFTASWRMITLAFMAVAIGVIGALLAVILLRAIALFTNIFFFGRISLDNVSPAANHLGPWVILVPVVGGLIIGLMARFGSDRIRGHGIPEAIEAILIGGSRVEPRVAILKPVSSAISIGSGGPFGAEGPIILTGGAVGSLIAQLFSMTDAERKTLLVAGAAAGMSATFGTPVAAVLLAVELLLFEWKPRSLVPVAVASASAAVARRYLLGMPPLFPTPAHPANVSLQTLLACVVAGVVAGALSSLMTLAVYAAEDFFHRLPIHWMWWPALGGIAVGVGGLIYPPALGVGYDVIGTMLAGDATIRMFLGVLFVKTTIWAIALGSGTSGGVLAPLLMIGGAMGGLEALGFPPNGPGFWPLIGMAAILGGTMRAPLTGVVFTLELTHDVNLLLPLLVATTIAYAFTVLAMKRSILTEKVSRRGFHLTREYSVDPLELTLTRQVMRTDVVALPASLPLTDLPALREQGGMRQGLYPVIDDQGDLVGVVSRSDLQRLTSEPHPPGATLFESVRRDPLVAYPDELLRNVVARMAASGRTRFPVVAPDNPKKLVGMIGLTDVLRVRELTERAERDRERVLRLRFHRPRRPHLAHAASGRDPVQPLD